jgi:LacI family transcriptional regulator
VGGWPQYLLDLGYERIGYIAAERGKRTNLDRLEAYKEALQGRGIVFDPALVVLGDGYAEGGREAIRGKGTCTC